MENFIEKKRKLPRELQEYLDSPQVYIDDEAVFHAFDLSQDVTSRIAGIVGRIFVGLEPVRNLKDNIAAVVGDESLACGIATSILEKSFLRFPLHFSDAKQLISEWELNGFKPRISIDVAEENYKVSNDWLFPKEDDQKTSPRLNLTKKSVLNIKLSLLKALADYPRLGEQTMSSEKIKLKNQSEPQRPNLANWIHYYREELGIGFHDQVTRGRFLFQSENGKRLSAEERERLNLVIKSIEEDFPIDIDTEHQIIIFPTRPTVAQPTAKPLFSQPNVVPARAVKPFQPITTPAVPVASETPSAGEAKPSFFDRQFRPAKNVAGDTLHFSTGHVLPGEKESAPSQSAPTAAMPHTQPSAPAFRQNGIVREKGAALPRSPYSIRPLRMRSDDAE